MEGLRLSNVSVWFIFSRSPSGYSFMVAVEEGTLADHSQEPQILN
jgi:hypothetical protein